MLLPLASLRTANAEASRAKDSDEVIKSAGGCSAGEL